MEYLELISKSDAKLALDWNLLGDNADKAKKIICGLPVYEIPVNELINKYPNENNKISTNGDYIRNMTNEELAEFLSQLKGSTILFYKQGYEISIQELVSLNWLNAPYILNYN